jgi:predicted ATPase/DNA-binding SARP family transcriptional activator
MTVRDPPATPLAVSLLGPFAVCVNGVPLPRLHSRKVEAILALLILRHDRPVKRPWLAALLWPDASPSQALATLRRYVGYLRRALGPEAGRLLSPTPHSLALDLTGCAVDLVAFDAALAQGDRLSLEQAVALYRGPLLEGWTDEWVFEEQVRREQSLLSALEALAAEARARGDRAAAEQHLRRVVATDPLRESAQRELMALLARAGNYGAALEVYRELRLRLHEELNAAPDAATAALFELLRQEARGKAAQGSEFRVQGPAESRTPAELGTGSREPSFSTSTVTFLFTDVEGSTRLWEEQPDAMPAALLRHDTLLHAAIRAAGGQVFKTMGDQFCAAFATAPEAMTAALAAQRALQAQTWHQGPPLRVRMALHTGTAQQREGDYFGPTFNRLARLLDTGHGGQILLSLATVELVRDQLPEGADLRDLGERRLPDLSRPEQIFQLVVPDLPAHFPPLRSLEAFAHNLPLQLTRFIGREREIAAVKRLLQQTRLLTLTGAGGCGKTRLALQVGVDLLEEHADGVWLVELAALADPSLVAQTVATALGVREGPGHPLTETLIDTLRPKQVLLLLDNCEHLLPACAHLTENLLQACPQLRVLATSREALGLLGEQSYRVGPLSLPEPRQLPPLERLQEYEAVQLFTDRAGLGQAMFALTAANAASVVQVCQQLDGMPLAIELAAARVKALPVEQIAARLDDMFRLLTGGSRTALRRHQTLRALIDWSYDLLSEEERALLRRLSVFAGGWTLEAAEGVCEGDVIEAWQVFDLLTSLVEKSLVIYNERERDVRNRLLETVRQYARDRLLEVGETASVQGRHRDWFLALAERAEPELGGPEARTWLDRLEAEHENLRAALAWSGAQGHIEAGLRLVGALAEFWFVRGYLREGRQHLAGLLALPGAEARTAARAKALRGVGLLASLQGDHQAARALSEESLAIFRELGDRRGIALSLNYLGYVPPDRGNEAAKRALFEESLSIFREMGDKLGIADSLLNLGNLAAEQGEHEAAQMLVEESLAIFREIGHKHGIALSLRWLGRAAQQEGEYEAARALLEESLAISQELGDKVGSAGHLNRLGMLAHDQGDHVAARALFEESLAIYRELGHKDGMARSLGFLGLVANSKGEYQAARASLNESLAIFRELGNKEGIVKDLEGLAAVAVAQGAAERAARLFGAAAALREAIGAPLPPDERADYERQEAPVRAALHEAAFAAAWAAGRAMPLDDAVAFALDETHMGG